MVDGFSEKSNPRFFRYKDILRGQMLRFETGNESWNKDISISDLLEANHEADIYGTVAHKFKGAGWRSDKRLKVCLAVAVKGPDFEHQEDIKADHDGDHYARNMLTTKKRSFHHPAKLVTLLRNGWSQWPGTGGHDAAEYANGSFGV